MCISATISNYLGLVSSGTHGIEMQSQGKQIAVFANHRSVKRNWREAVMFAVGWRQTLFNSASDAQAYASDRNLVVYTWQCFGRENWLRRGATNVDAFCYIVLPIDVPESVRLPDDDGDNMPSDELQ
jgi:hypothetical protein